MGAPALNEMSENWVYSFGSEQVDGNASMRKVLGGKGANLAEMAKLGLPVPPGFTISTEVCGVYYDLDRDYPSGLREQVDEALKRLERDAGKGFGNPDNPLLVSVRSGGRASMPGMMDTVLNLGLNDVTVEGLAKLSGDRRFAYDSYRRFIQMYSNVVLGLSHDVFEYCLDDYKSAHDLNFDTELSAENWIEIVEQYKKLVIANHNHAFPESPLEQLWGAVGAVFGSWMSDRAILYRKLNDIPEKWGTAVNIQAMVFGNMGDQSATGVAFTRDPSTGAKSFYGEYLINAQGEDVVAGIRTPAPISEKRRTELGTDDASLETALPQSYAQLIKIAEQLEHHYKDMQDIEFTIEQGRLYMLQTRSGKRTTAAALKIAIDMQKEGLISKEEAVLRIEPIQLDQLLHPTIAEDAERKLLVRGLPASPGAAVGQAVFNSDEAAELAGKGEEVILIRTETSPEDIHGMHAARAIVTARGGMTSHAAVVARGMGRPCVCGAGSMQVDEAAGLARIYDIEIKKGDIVTVDGANGEVLAGQVKMIEPDLSGDFGKLMQWADSARVLKVRGNAETPADVEMAKSLGAEGIGLCRTEHMFFDTERIDVVRAMILAEDKKGRQAALDKLLPMQRDDFMAIFKIMEERPCTIRLLDPPLHEFLPQSDADIDGIAESMGVNPKDLTERIKALHESNPMLGHRGCRLGLTYPEIYRMQVRAIFEAALHVAKETGKSPKPEIMVPLVATAREFTLIKQDIDQLAEEIFSKASKRVTYMTGTMIELPRAAIMAADIAQQAEFFSFGTNDLTQTALGISRDDAGRFLKIYEEKGVYEKDPFVTLDIDGVGELIKMGAERGRTNRPDIKLGICGEHGGDPASIAFCHKIGLEYVSCSPYRIPVARLAAAHAALKKKKKKR